MEVSGSFLQYVGSTEDIPRASWHQSRMILIMEHQLAPEVILE